MVQSNRVVSWVDYQLFSLSLEKTLHFFCEEISLLSPSSVLPRTRKFFLFRLPLWPKLTRSSLKLLSVPDIQVSQGRWGSNQNQEGIITWKNINLNSFTFSLIMIRIIVVSRYRPLFLPFQVRTETVNDRMYSIGWIRWCFTPTNDVVIVIPTSLLSFPVILLHELCHGTHLIRGTYMLILYSRK